MWWCFDWPFGFCHTCHVLCHPQQTQAACGTAGAAVVCWLARICWFGLVSGLHHGRGTPAALAAQRFGVVRHPPSPRLLTLLQLLLCREAGKTQNHASVGHERLHAECMLDSRTVHLFVWRVCVCLQRIPMKPPTWRLPLSGLSWHWCIGCNSARSCLPLSCWQRVGSSAGSARRARQASGLSALGVAASLLRGCTGGCVNLFLPPALPLLQFLQCVHTIYYMWARVTHLQ